MVPLFLIFFNMDWLDILDSNLTAKEIFVVARTNVKPNYKTLLSNGASRCMLRMGNGSLSFEQAYHSFAGSDGAYKVDGFYFRDFEQSEKHILSARLGSDSEHSGYFQNMKIGRQSSSRQTTGREIFMRFWFLIVFSMISKRIMLNGIFQRNGGFRTSARGGYAHRLKPRSPGINHLLSRMNLRVATDAEVTRAREATTPGNVNKFVPSHRILPQGNRRR